MAEQKSLIVHVARQTLTTPAKPTASLVGRGLAAIRNGGVLAKSQDQDALYLKAREIYERYWWGEDWQQSEHAPELVEAFTIFQRLVKQGYGKAYFPLFQMYRAWGEYQADLFLGYAPIDLAGRGFTWCFDNQFQDDPAIWNDLGELYESALVNDKPNYELAFYWYKKAAELGYADAQYNLGLLYRDGKGVKQDNNQAVSWIKKAAKQDDALAQNNLGSMYEKGIGVVQDNDKAVKWFTKAAERGDAFGQCNLGLMYEKGKGIEQDDSLAANWYAKAAKQGHYKAQRYLGSMYLDGRGIKQDFAEAAKWFEKAAEQGDSIAQNNLGWMYEDGNGVGQDYNQAVYWFEKAAMQGEVIAQYKLGLMYDEGRGVEQDDTQAAYWFEKAAMQGEATAQFKLGLKYEEGNGVEQNFEQAVYWYEQAAKQGNVTAINNLYRINLNGNGIKQLNREATHDTVPFPFGMQDSNGRVISIFRAGIEVPCESIIFIKLNQRDTDKYVFNVFTGIYQIAKEAFQVCKVAVESKNNQNEIQLKFNIDIYGLLHIQAFSAQTGDPLQTEIKELS